MKVWKMRKSFIQKYPWLTIGLLGGGAALLLLSRGTAEPETETEEDSPGKANNPPYANWQQCIESVVNVVTDEQFVNVAGVALDFAHFQEVIEIISSLKTLIGNDKVCEAAKIFNEIW